MAGNVAAVVLAAGFSSRMGEFKPLLPLDGAMVLERVVTLFQGAGIGDVRVVVGHRAAELEPIVSRLGARVIANPHYRDGMFTSVAAGVATIGEEVDAFFVLPVDVPLVRGATIRRLLDAYRQEPCDVIYPRFQGQRGHPPLIAGRHAPEIAGWQDTGGLRAVLAQWNPGARDVDVADELILWDMDTPDDYLLLQGKADRLEIPTEEECLVLLERVLCVDDRIIGHGKAVADVAVLLGMALNRAGCGLDISLLTAAGLLHDLARKEPDHARIGARLLRDMGYGAVAELVAVHMDMSVTEGEPVTAGEVIYLADKLVQGERRVSVTERFRAAMERHAHDPAILGRVAARLKTAMTIQQRLEAILGRSLTEITDTL